MKLRSTWKQRRESKLKVKYHSTMSKDNYYDRYCSLLHDHCWQMECLKCQECVRHYVLCVVEQPAAPQCVFATCVRVEIAAVCAVKHVESIGRVARRVTMNQIQIHSQTVTVSDINQLLQFLWRSVATAYQHTATCNTASSQDHVYIYAKSTNEHFLMLLYVINQSINQSIMNY